MVTQDNITSSTPMGANLLASPLGQGATFRVWAPLANAVHLNGAFNGVQSWTLDADLVSLAAWSALWGIPGAFLAVPITAIMAIVFSAFAGTRPIAVLLSRDGRL